MLFKLSIRNIRRSLKDYAIYFFTLIVGVAVFYVFNSITSQRAYKEFERSSFDMASIIKTVLSGTSVFVALILGLLIVYASRFLMKRRNKEFAVYMTLGMGKGKISMILLLETVIIGAGSLIIGLVLGVGISQFMSAFVTDLFESDMSKYSFTFSAPAVGKTVLYFTLMFVVVMIFNSTVISKCKLINLLNSRQRAEMKKLPNPIISAVVFAVSVILLGFAYRSVNVFNEGSAMSSSTAMIRCIIFGIIGTFMLFWSLSGLVLRIAMLIKGTYFSGINSFTFRQISSKMNTAVISMSVISILLFLIMSVLTASTAVRNALNDNVKNYCPADYQLYCCYKKEANIEGVPEVEKIINSSTSGLDSYFKEYEIISGYDAGITVKDILGEKLDAEYRRDSAYGVISVETNSKVHIFSESDYNRLMEFYGWDKVDVESDGCKLVWNDSNIENAYRKAVSEGRELTVSGYKVKLSSGDMVNGLVDIGLQPLNTGFLVVDDEALEGLSPRMSYLTANYNIRDRQQWREMENRVHDDIPMAFKDSNILLHPITKLDITDEAIGVGAIMTFIGLYLGIVFLISCAAILALKQLSESVDSAYRYDMLRKIGVEEKSIRVSLFIQTAVFFFVPLSVALIHTLAGYKFISFFVDLFGKGVMKGSALSTVSIITLIYGGYFLITYFCSKMIIKGKSR